MSKKKNPSIDLLSVAFNKVQAKEKKYSDTSRGCCEKSRESGAARSS